MYRKWIIACFSLTCLVVYGQENLRADQAGFYFPVDIAQPSVRRLETQGAGSWQQEAEREALSSGRYLLGEVVADSVDMLSAGSWSLLPDGRKMCAIQFEVSGVQALSAYFSDFYLPEGSGLFAYGKDPRGDFQYFDYKENNDHGQFMTTEIWGETLILVYVQGPHVSEATRLNISGLSCYHRLREALNEREATCQVDVNCSEGDHWKKQKDSVVRLLVTKGASTFLCTGTMVNTTAMDCRSYMLTANHCTYDVSETDLRYMQVRFHFEKNQCGTTGIVASNNLTGVVLLADSDDNGGFEGSDFALFTTEDPIPELWTVYYAGWDVSGLGSSSGVCIHHPAGDYKKISTYTTDLGITAYPNPDDLPASTHWNVYWSSTTNGFGVTEGGSSGAPLFNSEGQLIGTLTGGTSSCSNLDGADQFGRMVYHWTGNPNAADQKLKAWLDPLNTGVKQLEGAYAPNCNPNVVESISGDGRLYQWLIYPNPCSDLLNLSLETYGGKMRITLYDSQGRSLMNEVREGKDIAFDMSLFAPGIYYLCVALEDGLVLSEKVLVE